MALGLLPSTSKQPPQIGRIAASAAFNAQGKVVLESQDGGTAVFSVGSPTPPSDPTPIPKVPKKKTSSDVSAPVFLHHNLVLD